MVKNAIKKMLRFSGFEASKTNLFEKKSYSQSGEDLIIKFLFDAIGIKNPSYIDIGAHHPFYLSNTAIFYENGSRGINIEPDPTLFERFKYDRKNDINLNIGIGEAPSIADFYIINVPTLNTFSASEAQKYREEGDFFIKETVKIKIDTIQNVIRTHFTNQFPDFLSLDAEGIDEIVLKGLDEIDTKPTVICVETISFSQSGNGIKNNEIVNFLTSRGYLLYADTNINSIFILKTKWVR